MKTEKRGSPMLRVTQPRPRNHPISVVIIMMVITTMIMVASAAASGNKQDLKVTVADIVGGVVARPLDARYFVQILFEDYLTDFYSTGCGGTLVSECHVLTAAHCAKENIVKRKKYVVFVGMYSTVGLHNNSGLPYHISDAQFIPHPAYDMKSAGHNISTHHAHDIAVLQMKYCVDHDETPIHPVVLADRDYETGLEPGDMMLAMGYGNQGYDNHTEVEVLRKVLLPLVPRRTCQDMLQPLTTSLVTKDMLCAGSKDGGKDTCQGDSGGPLVHIKQEKSWSTDAVATATQIGVTSWGVGCGDNPGVFSSVPAHFNWLKKTICIDLRLNPSITSLCTRKSTGCDIPWRNITDGSQSQSCQHGHGSPMGVGASLHNHLRSWPWWHHTGLLLSMSLAKRMLF